MVGGDILCPRLTGLNGKLPIETGSGGTIYSLIGGLRRQSMHKENNMKKKLVNDRSHCLCAKMKYAIHSDTMQHHNFLQTRLKWTPLSHPLGTTLNNVLTGSMKNTFKYVNMFRKCCLRYVKMYAVDRFCSAWVRFLRWILVVISRTVAAWGRASAALVFT